MENQKVIESSFTIVKESENLGVGVLGDSDLPINDSVNAVEQEVAEKIPAKELEVAGFTATLHTMEHDKMRGTLGSLTNTAREQIKIDGLRECSRILQEEASGSWVGIYRVFETLKTTLDSICTWVDSARESSRCEWQQEQDFRGELEAMVIRICIRGNHEELEEKLWGQNAPFCGSQSANWPQKINAISSLRKELEAILKLLPSSETGHLISHGSYDIDHFHHKALSNHVSSSTSLRAENVKFDDSRTGISEKLKHMSKDDLVKHYDTVITEMKRNHESELQQLTDEYFARRSEYLKERDSSLHPRRDKEFDALRKMNPKVEENEKLYALSNNAKSLGSSKDRLENLLLENRLLSDSLTENEKKLNCLSSQLSNAVEKKGNLESAAEDAHIEAFVKEEVYKCVHREVMAQIKCDTENTLTEKEKELNRLSSQLSNVAEKMSHHSSTEENLRKLIGNLESAAEDAHIEAFVKEEVYICIHREVMAQIKCDTEDSEIVSIIMQDIHTIIFREVAHNSKATSKCEIKDSDLDILFMQGLCGFIFTEAIKVAKSQFNDLNSKYICENEKRVSLEIKAEREKESILEFEEKERIKQEVLLVLMAALTDEKDKIAHEVSEALTKEREQRKQMEAVTILVHGLSKALSDFECRALGGMEKNNMRLEYLGSQLNYLIQEANILRTTGLVYKQRLEKRCSDLQMAEAEVDLLGDQVDKFSSLLEKIYIGLDHYSPILQHYPGIVETLKLVRKEIIEESTKSI